MKVASNIVFLFKDTSSFASSISEALNPNPNPNDSSLRRSQESFELSLERYGIRDQKASGSLVHFIDDKGTYQVTVLLLEKYKPPILAYAVTEVLEQITKDASSLMPTFVAPFLVASSKLKQKNTILLANCSKATINGLQVGPETDTTRALATKIQKLPSSLQIHYEPLSCFLQLARVLKLPTFLLIGQSGLHPSRKASDEELETLCEMGEVLASSFSLCFSRDGIRHNPPGVSKDSEEPWRALYG